MKAEIITIGDELLIGQVVDTNSAWIATELNKIGVSIYQITSVSDQAEHIKKAISEASERAEIILITGGLGPTRDDITKQTLCDFFGSKLVLNQEALENVANIFKRFNAPLLDVNIKQAEVPDNCEVLQNKNGTAPGMLFRKQGKLFVSMPGVPFEMMAMMENQVIPIMSEMFQMPSIIHKTLLTSGVGESFIAKKLEKIEDSLPANLKIAYLPKLGQVRIRLSAYGNDKQQLTEQSKDWFGQIKETIATHIIFEGDGFVEHGVVEALKSKGKTLAIAESCTGGYISHLITSIPGVSSVYQGSVVPYSYEMKTNLLGVSSDSLVKYGAVSEQVVAEMLKGTLGVFNADFAIAVSGVAGPDGGTPEKPVGFVYVGVASKNNTLIKSFRFGNKRVQNIERSAVAALTMMYHEIMKEK